MVCLGLICGLANEITNALVLTKEVALFFPFTPKLFFASFTMYCRNERRYLHSLFYFTSIHRPNFHTRTLAKHLQRLNSQRQANFALFSTLEKWVKLPPLSFDWAVQ